MKSSILIIDDDTEVRSMIADVLEDEGYSVAQAGNWETAKDVLENKEINLIFLDLWIDENEYDGIVILERIKKKYPAIPVVMISGHGNIEIAVKAIKYGAYDFIEKPFVIERMLITASRAIESATLKIENVGLRRKKHGSNVVLVGKSHYASKLRSNAVKAASNSGTAYISSHPGGEADELAWLIHCNSSRKENRFLTFDCKVDDQNYLIREIFGSQTNKGFIRNSNGGTLFLNNISSLGEEAQRALLIYLQSGNVNGVNCDTRLICSDRYSVSELSNFVLPDLLQRILIHELDIKPLKDRCADVEDIIDYYYMNSVLLFGVSKPPELSKGARDIMVAYSWPGNIAQIRNTLEILFLITKNEIISVNDLYIGLQSATESDISPFQKYFNMTIKDARDAFEKEFLAYNLRKFGNSMTNVAKAIDMDRSALYKKVRGLGLDIDESEKEG